VATFALVHGAWHDASCWEPLRELLARAGHRVVAPDLPCDDVAAGFDEYAAATIAALGDGDEPAVLVGHSLGSDTIAVVAAARPVARLVYLCPRMGGFERGPDEPRAFRRSFRWTGTDELGRTYWSAEDARRVMYPRLEPELAERAAVRLRPQADLRWAAYPLARPPAVPSTFVLALEDECFDVDWSRWAAGALLGVEPVELPGGHFPMLERPAELAELLERAML
jgi:pimeloyl-ACP methyl ester carboxylesterase